MKTETRLESRLLTMNELAEYLGVRKKRLYEWSSSGIGPTPIKVGGGLRYRPSNVDRWLDGQAKWGDPAA